MMFLFVLAASALAPSAVPVSKVSSAGSTYVSCADQWKARRGNGSTVKPSADFSRQCLMAGRAPPPPLTEQQARLALAQHVTAANTFVTSPPTDIAVFCAGYRSHSANEQVTFWRELFFAMMKPESGYKPASYMWDEPEYSVGLLQMSLHNGCAVRTEQDLMEPSANILCAVKKMETLAASSGSGGGRFGGDLAHPREGASRYWSTLRVPAAKPVPTKTDSRSDIIHATQALPACRVAS